MIGTLFQSRGVSSWSDILPSFTEKCLEGLDECATLLFSFVNSDVQSTGPTAESLFTELIDDMLSQPVDVRGILKMPDFLMVAMSDVHSVSRPILPASERPRLIRAVKARMLLLRHGLRQENDFALRIRVGNEIRTLCAYIIRLTDYPENYRSVDTVMQDILDKLWGV